MIILKKDFIKYYRYLLLIMGISLGSFTCTKMNKCIYTTKTDTIYINQKSGYSLPVTDTIPSDPLHDPGTVLVSSDNIVRDTSDELNSFAWTENGNPVINRTIFTFDLDNIPVGSIIDSAILSLYYDSTSTSTSGQSNATNSDASLIQRVISQWNPMNTTWANQPATTTANEVNVPQSTSMYEDYPDLNVTPLVQDMVNNPTSSFGFEIRLITEQPYCALLFCSALYVNPARRPKLIVVYTPK